MKEPALKISADEGACSVLYSPPADSTHWPSMPMNTKHILHFVSPWQQGTNQLTNLILDKANTLGGKVSLRELTAPGKTNGPDQQH